MEENSSEEESVHTEFPRLVDITAECDFLGIYDQKSSYKHVSDFGRLRSYGHFFNFRKRFCVNRVLRNRQARDLLGVLSQLQTLQFVYGMHGRWGGECTKPSSRYSFVKAWATFLSAC